MTSRHNADLGAGLVLAIETAGSACSAAVARDGAIAAHDRRTMRHGHAEALMPMIAAIADAAGVAPLDLDRVAVAVGPGGFTGIRAGIAAAQGIALAVDAALIGVTCFAAVAAPLQLRGPGTAPLLVALDSRRAELYVQLFGAPGAPLSQPTALPPADLPDLIAASATGGRLIVAGDAAEIAAAALCNAVDAVVLPETAADARGVVAALRPEWRGGGVGPAAPLYLRPPDVTLPKTPEPIALGTG